MPINEREFGAIVAAVESRVGRSSGGCGGMENTFAAWQEALRQGGVRKKGVVRQRIGLVSLANTLNSSTTSATKDYRTPSDEVFVINDIRARLGFNAWESEPASVGNMNPLAEDRYMIKAGNCQVGLTDQDAGLSIFIDSDMVLADIIREPIKIPAPGLIIKPATTLRMTTTLQSTNTNVIGAASTYGLVMSGWFLSVVGG